LDIFTKELVALDKTIDPCVHSAAQGQNPESYLPVLNRLTDIESECFTVQQRFLEKGQV
jgi:hypothetical protein